MRIAATTVAGGGTREVARRIASAHRGEMMVCYRRALASNPKLEAELELTIMLAAGRVRSVLVDGGADSRALAACVDTAASRWRFPAEFGGNTIVRQTVGFELR